MRFAPFDTSRQASIPQDRLTGYLSSWLRVSNPVRLRRGQRSRLTVDRRSRDPRVRLPHGTGPVLRRQGQPFGAHERDVVDAEEAEQLAQVGLLEIGRTLVAQC